MYDSFYHKEFNGVILMVAIGSSRGGGNTKAHVLINERMQLLRVIDGRAGSKIFSAKAYNCEKFRFFIAERGTFWQAQF